MRRTHPLIVGGGPSACAAAILLARQGGKPLILERTREPHDIVCGGFLSTDTIGLLARVGLSAEALGARRIDRLRLVAGTRIFEADLPFTAFGLSRFRLDAVLIELAAEAGAGVERGVSAKRLDSEARRVYLSDGSSLSSDTVLLATGKLDLRGTSRPGAASGNDPAVGFRTRLEPSKTMSAALAGVIELHIFRGGYAGLLLLEDGGANLCLSVKKSRLSAGARTPDLLLEALADENLHFADRLGGAQSSGRWSSIANIPYGWRAQPDHPGIFRLGDQGAVIASLAGDGIGIALASGAMASAALQTGGAEASHRFQMALRSRSRGPLWTAGALKWIAEHPIAHGPAMTIMASSPGLMRFAAMATRIGDGA
jgi:flavin-dependent dehydrogenase